MLRIDLNEPQILQKVTNNRFGLLVSQEWKRLLNPYTPRDNGILMNTAEERPWEIKYIQPYSHYMYQGILYVDPDTRSSWARFGVEKVSTGEPLNYQKNNPFATDHWDIKAAEAGQLDKLYRTLNNALQSGQF